MKSTGQLEMSDKILFGLTKILRISSTFKSFVWPVSDRLWKVFAYPVKQKIKKL